MPTNNRSQDETLPLHYIDKIHAVLIETGRGINYAMIATVVLSIVVLSLSAGAISVDKEFSFGGLKFEVTSWVVLFGGTSLICVLHIYFLALSNHEHHLREIIIRLYKSVGLSDESLNETKIHPLESPNMFALIFEETYVGKSALTKNFFGVIDTVLLLTLFLLPLAVEIIVGYKVSSLLNWAWWAISSFAFLLLMSGSYIVAYVMNLRNK